MTAGLLAGIAGLALLDALNPATVAGVALLLLTPRRHPTRAAAAFVGGAYLTVLGLGMLVYAGADTADAVGNGLVRVRRTAFTVAAVALAVAGLRRCLSSLYERLGAEKKQPRNAPIAVGHLAAAAGVLAIAALA